MQDCLQLQKTRHRASSGPQQPTLLLLTSVRLTRIALLPQTVFAASLHVLELKWEIRLWSFILDVSYQPQFSAAAVIVIFIVQG